MLLPHRVLHLPILQKGIRDSLVLLPAIHSAPSDVLPPSDQQRIRNTRLLWRTVRDPARERFHLAETRVSVRNEMRSAVSDLIAL